MEYTRKQLLAMTIWGEARGEMKNSPLGGILVGQVIINRWKKPCWWGRSLKGVILKPWQFSCWNDNDPNKEKMYAVMDNMAAGGDDKLMRQCMHIAQGLILGYYMDYSGGANHYFSMNMSRPPKWSRGKTPVRIEGNHAFYRL